MTHTAAPPLSSTDRPRFVAPAFDVARFHVDSRQRFFWLVVLLLCGIATAIIAISFRGPMWMQILVYPGVGLGYLFAARELSLRVEVSTRAVRQTSLFVTTEVAWTEVDSIRTWSDIPIAERAVLRPPSALSAWPGIIASGAIFSGAAQNFYGPWAFVVGMAAVAGWGVLVHWLWFRLRHPRLMTMRITRESGREIAFRVWLSGRDFVSLKRHLRRCALEHGIDPPW